TKALLKALEEMKTDEYDRYVSFYKELGPILKEGPGRDHDNRERIADLFLFESSNTPAGQLTTLSKYVESMPPDQKEVLYLTGETREQIEHSPYLEAFRAKGQDVLLLTDPVDEFMVNALQKYRDRPLRAVDRVDPGDAGVDAAQKEQ